jgi:hypothetical protein
MGTEWRYFCLPFLGWSIEIFALQVTLFELSRGKSTTVELGH